jgi:5'-methylthioadenosine phosphorylase
LVNLQPVTVETPFGSPSDEYMIGELNGKRIAFLPRHARGHRIMPSEINFRANIYGFKKLGVERIISVSAVGSMKENIRPGDIVIVSQFFDKTTKRVSTFFGQGLVAHVGMSDPVCPELSKLLLAAGKKLKFNMHQGGTYLCIEGPQFSTRGESHVYRQWGVDVIGMTNIPEAKLAREAEICYATIALATDYDCWRSSEAAVTADAVVKVLMENVSKSKALLKEVIAKLPTGRDCHCGQALENAIITDRNKIPAKIKSQLDIIVGKYLK